ncbi:MAG TPA: hypothetical protein VEA41_09575 [Salinarimonas sp.]|nr:hypothetical protein [Salinarimonas sp.]
MRAALAFLAFLVAGPALAQAPDARSLEGMRPQDAARLNQAVQNDPQARQALDRVEKTLTQGGHKAGQMLEKTRP